MITIGQLAAYAGVTTKAVRHYHDRGLLPEPPRDSSGYRRYDARHAVALVKIATLARAGVPLARVKDLLAADTDEFGAAIDDIDRDLEARIEELRHTRERLAGLRVSDQVFISPEAADYLERMRELGISERGLTIERDAWIMVDVVDPEFAGQVAADKLRMLDQPEFCEIIVEYDRVFDLDPGDPRIEALAHRTARWLATQPIEVPLQWRSAADPVAVQRLLSTAGESSPAWDRVAEIMAEL